MRKFLIGVTVVAVVCMSMGCGNPQKKNDSIKTEANENNVETPEDEKSAEKIKPERKNLDSDYWIGEWDAIMENDGEECNIHLVLAADGTMSWTEKRKRKVPILGKFEVVTSQNGTYEYSSPNFEWNLDRESTTFKVRGLQEENKKMAKPMEKKLNEMVEAGEDPFGYSESEVILSPNVSSDGIVEELDFTMMLNGEEVYTFTFK